MKYHLEVVIEGCVIRFVAHNEKGGAVELEKMLGRWFRIELVGKRVLVIEETYQAPVALELAVQNAIRAFDGLYEQARQKNGNGRCSECRQYSKLSEKLRWGLKSH